MQYLIKLSIKHGRIGGESFGSAPPKDTLLRRVLIRSHYVNLC